jgi:hypothetical protein
LNSGPGIPGEPHFPEFLSFVWGGCVIEL